MALLVNVAPNLFDKLKVQWTTTTHGMCKIPAMNVSAAVGPFPASGIGPMRNFGIATACTASLQLL
jgi:hypothetical protein